MTENHGWARAEDFLDPDDPRLYPRLSDAQIAELATVAETVARAPGEILLEQGQRGTPFYVVQSGSVDIFDRCPEGVRYFTQCRGGTFIGQIAFFTGEPTLAAGAAAEPTELLAISPAALRRFVVAARNSAISSCERWLPAGPDASEHDGSPRGRREGLGAGLAGDRRHQRRSGPGHRCLARPGPAAGRRARPAVLPADHHGQGWG
jgi:Cyclic nucleotide-binding domain